MQCTSEHCTVYNVHGNAHNLKRDIFSGCSGDTSYHFRIRKEYTVAKQRDDISSRDSHYYYGYVFFRLDSSCLAYTFTHLHIFSQLK